MTFLGLNSTVRYEEDENEKLRLMFISERAPQHEGRSWSFGTWQISYHHSFVYILYLFFGILFSMCASKVAFNKLAMHI
jgi:hypothetical protein